MRLSAAFLHTKNFRGIVCSTGLKRKTIMITDILLTVLVVCTLDKCRCDKHDKYECDYEYDYDKDYCKNDYDKCNCKDKFDYKFDRYDCVCKRHEYEKDCDKHERNYDNGLVKCRREKCEEPKKEKCKCQYQMLYKGSCCCKDGYGVFPGDFRR